MRRPMQYAPGEKPRTITTLELIPEEALYLVERGSMLCFKSGRRMTPELVQELDPDAASFAEEPMTVQQAFSEMIGKENLTLARYEVRASSGHSHSLYCSYAFLISLCSAMRTSNV